MSEIDWEERAHRAEEALEEALRERNELWRDLHRGVALERELEHCRELNMQFESSLSWRITAPLRVAKRLSHGAEGRARALLRRASR